MKTSRWTVSNSGRETVRPASGQFGPAVGEPPRAGEFQQRWCSSFGSAKRLECVELAPAFEPPPPCDSASKLDALHTLRVVVHPYGLPSSRGKQHRHTRCVSGVPSALILHPTYCALNLNRGRPGLTPSHCGLRGCRARGTEGIFAGLRNQILPRPLHGAVFSVKQKLPIYCRYFFIC